jgi:PAS domain S-box-containing protein
MKKKKAAPLPGLLHKAERRLEKHNEAPDHPQTHQDALRLLHQLQVHQVELEIQNEELKTAREEVEAGLVQYTALYDFAPVGYFTFDRSGAILRVNLTGSRLMGIDRSRLVGRRFERWVSDADRRALKDFFEKVFAGSAAFCEVTLGREGAAPLAVRIEAAGADDGTECRAIMTDITARRVAEERIARRTRRFQILSTALQEINSVLDVSVIMRRLVAYALEVADAASGAAGLVVENKMVFTEYNKEGQTFPIDYRFGPGEGVPGWVMQTRAPHVSADAEHDIHVVQEIRETLGFKTLADVPILSRNGQLMGCFEIHDKRGGPFDEDDLDMLKGLAAGATIALEHVQHLQDQKRSEVQLREAHSRLKATMDALPDLLFVVDREGCIYDFHAPHPEHLYVSPEQFMGKRMGDVLPEPAAGIAVKAIAQAVAQGRHKGAVYPLGTHVGQRWFELSIVAQGDMQTAEGRLVILAHDITDLKRAEEAIKQTAEDLRRSNLDLEQFAYVASHDLKEPLRMVTGFMDLLQRSCGEAIDDKGRECMSFAMEGGKRMQVLIDALLEYGRIGRQVVVQPTDLEAVLERVLASQGRIIEESQVTLTHDPLPTVQGNPVELELLLQNLIENAVKFRGDRKLDIHIGAHQQGNHWLFSVRDNGIGLDPKFADRIFVIFQRLHSRDKYPGTGIGLAICKKIVERHGGSICVDSVPGQGSTFYFTLPA